MTLIYLIYDSCIQRTNGIARRINLQIWFPLVLKLVIYQKSVSCFPAVLLARTFVVIDIYYIVFFAYMALPLQFINCAITSMNFFRFKSQASCCTLLGFPFITGFAFITS